MKIVKRLLAIVGILIVLLLATAIIIPVFFKDKIMAVVKTEMNKQLNAKADFNDVDISILRSFPQLSVGITNVSVVGIDEFQNDTLIAAKSIEVALDLMKAINGEYDIRKIGLISPRIHAIVLKDGKANWDIAKPSPETTTTEESAPFALELRKYAIENAYIEYDDKQGGMHVVIRNLTHTGSGNFSDAAFTLATNTTADAITFAYGGITYLNKVKTSIDLDLNIDNNTSKYTFNTQKIKLNGLELYTKGFVQMPDGAPMTMDIQYGTPSNDFKEILSLVPGIYQADFKDIKTSGKLGLSGFVKGKYSEKEMPSFMLNLGIKDASFQYPALPQKVSDIQVKLTVVNPDGIVDHTVVNLDQLHLKLGEEPFDFRMLLKTPVSNQWIDASAKGHINLGRVSQFIALEAGTKMLGDIKADVAVKGSIAEAQKQHFDKLDASGSIDIAGLSYASKDYPDGVSISSMLLTFNPRNVSVANLRGQFMDTHFSGNGSVDNFLGYFLNNESLTGRFSLIADKVDVNKLMGATADEATTETQTTESNGVFVVPANLDVELNTTIGTLKYDDIVLTNVSGGVSVKNEVVDMRNIGGNGFDGTLKLSGSYSTAKNKKNPDIAFRYNIGNVDIKKLYNSFSTMQEMMPSAKYISGRLSSEFTMNGSLKEDMTPEMNSLSGKGDMMLLNGLISDYPVAVKLADKLKMPKLKTLKIQDMKLFFSFKNGRVVVEPFNVDLGSGIKAEVAGSHGFDQTLDYGANMAVPRALFGGEANGVLNSLVSKAAGNGVNVNLGENINVKVKVTGTSTNPKIETDLKSAAGDAVKEIKDEIKKVVKEKVDSVKHVVQDTVKAVKQQVVKEVEKKKEEVKEKAKEEVEKKKEEAKKEIKNEAKKKLKGLFGR